MVLDKNPDYFVPGKPAISKVTIRVVPDNTARLTNIANGQTDIVPEPPNNQVDVVVKTILGSGRVQS